MFSPGNKLVASIVSSGIVGVVPGLASSVPNVNTAGPPRKHFAGVDALRESMLSIISVRDLR